MWKDCYFLLYAFSFASGAKNEVIQYPSTTVTPLATSRDDTKSGCTFDPCMFLYEYCLNGGQCLINQSTCDATCVCVEGYSGYRCQNELNTRNENGENSSSGLTTVTSILGCSGEVCVHGRCVSAPFGTTRCRCDAGWFGANCGTAGAVVDDDILKQLSKISSSVSLGINDVGLLSDDTDQKESLNDDAGQMDNKQQMQNIHINNNLFIEMDNKQNNSFEVNETDAVLESAFDQRYNICSENPIERNEEEKRCKTSGDLKCVYGVCEETLTDHGTWKGYTTVCKCDPGARGILCEHRCCLDCGENGKCDIHEDGDNITEHCNCRHRYTGLFCEIYVPNPVDVQVKEDTWYLWIVGVCVGTFIILVTMAILGPYFMWKHRVIVVMKIVHYFQAYEDDDDKEWDAFVSYKSHHIDEQFVVQVLYPKLEKELGFKLCLHFRDFVPGETISNNIINAVEGSRRTILILTPRYVESEFTRFEYQKAQTEMLKRKHRIIPIMLEDISGVTNMDKNLKGIISSVTYLEWPKSEEKEKKEDKFWKRLQLSLPKKKVSDFDQKTALTSVGSSFYSSSKDTSVSSGIDSWFGSSLMSSEDDFSTKSSTLRDSFDENIYSEIGAIDESLRVKTMSQNATPGDFSETVKPLSEEEEQGLMYSEANQVQDGREQTDDYIDMEHDRYIEFSLEDNPPSASLTRKKLNTNIILQSDGYIEVDV